MTLVKRRKEGWDEEAARGKERHENLPCMTDEHPLVHVMHIISVAQQQQQQHHHHSSSKRSKSEPLII